MDLTSKKENDDCNLMRKLYQPASQSSIPGHEYPIYMVTNKFNVEVVDDALKQQQVPYLEPPTTLDLKLFSTEMKLRKA